MRDEIADPFAALPMLFPVPGTFHHDARIALEQFNFAARIEFLSGAPDQFGFVIKRVALAGRPGHEQLDHAPSPGKRALCEWSSGWLCGLREETAFGKKLSEGNSAQTASQAPQKFTPAIGFPRRLEWERDWR